MAYRPVWRHAHVEMHRKLSEQGLPLRIYGLPRYFPCLCLRWTETFRDHEQDRWPWTRKAPHRRPRRGQHERHGGPAMRQTIASGCRSHWVFAGDCLYSLNGRPSQNRGVGCIARAVYFGVVYVTHCPVWRHAYVKTHPGLSRHDLPLGIYLTGRHFPNPCPCRAEALGYGEQGLRLRAREAPYRRSLRRQRGNDRIPVTIQAVGAGPACGRVSIAALYRRAGGVRGYPRLTQPQYADQAEPVDCAIQIRTRHD